MTRAIQLSFTLLLLAGCGGIGPPVIAGLPPASPSALPLVLSPTPPFVASPTPGGIEAATVTATDAIPMQTRTPTPADAALRLDILGCNTSLDLRHQMGEVTNAFPLVQNSGPGDLTGVCATLTASDEARLHPDKTVCLASLPAGHQVVLKLTVDTGFRQDTSIRVDVAADQGVASIARPSCTAIGLPGSVPDQVGAVQPIP